MEILLFRLETQRLHVTAGNLQWLGFTSSEVESVLDRLHFEALARNVDSAAVAAEWGLPAQATLIELAAGAPAGPWPEILHEHLDGLRALLAQLRDAAHANEEALRQQGTSVPSGGQGADGAAPPASDTARLLDQLTTAENIERALAVTRRTPQPLLARYLDGSSG
ncbi:flagellar protein FlgN [Arthrobacter sp. PsM3]|uniref:flagellar protein FlgN n=1 Tax=Arthrobacter sp. PsM3 TaxID=3030531 RepID=UPI00263BE7D4|nr:flagellar protein FlgN [Arthrobacter sp. PsM3]MDN4642507.1 flagellar protein FlgN [Arthrobacter sp. PsM3]